MGVACMTQVLAVMHVERDQVAHVERSSALRAMLGLMPEREFAVIFAPDYRFVIRSIRPEHNSYHLL